MSEHIVEPFLLSLVVALCVLLFHVVWLLDHKPRNGIHADEEALLSRVGSVKGSRSYPTGFSSSDAEIEYRRGRSLREGRENRRRR